MTTQAEIKRGPYWYFSADRKVTSAHHNMNVRSFFAYFDAMCLTYEWSMSSNFIEMANECVAAGIVFG